MHALLCHEAAELLLPQGFDARGALGVLAPDSQRAGARRDIGGSSRDVLSLGCDEEIVEEEDAMAVAAYDDAEHQAAAAALALRRQHQPPTTWAEPSAIRASANGSGGSNGARAMVRPPMGPNTTRAPLPLPPPPRALGRSQSLPAYHTSVNYYGGNGHAYGNGHGHGHDKQHQPQQQPQHRPPVPPQPPQKQMQFEAPGQAQARATLPPPPPPPALLVRQRSFSCLSRPFRSTTGRFLSENLARVEEAAPREDVAERVVTMHAQERDYYAPPLAYFERLERDPLLAQWRRGAVRWFSKVVEHLHANREAIATATNFLDRHFGSRLYPSTAGAAAAAATEKGCPVDVDVDPFRPPPLLLDSDQEAFERGAVCALALALKMHQGDSTASLAPRLAALSSCALTPRALCALEFEMVGALGRYLNPPTPGTLIHHLLRFLPDADADAAATGAAAGPPGQVHKGGNKHNTHYKKKNQNQAQNRPLLLALDDHANDLALMALETPALAAFPVSVVAVAAILASFARLRGDGANKWLDPTLELRWLQALDVNDLKVEPDEITACLEQLGRQAKKAAAASNASISSGGSGNTNGSGMMGVGSPLSGVEGLFLPNYLNPPQPVGAQQQQQQAIPATPCLNGGEGKLARALSPTGVDEIALLEAEVAAQQQQQQAAMRGIVA